MTIAGDIVWNGAGDLRLEAARDIDIDATVRSTGTGDLSADATRDFTTTGLIRSDASGDLTLVAGGDFNIESTLRAAGTGTLTLTAREGDIRVADRAATDITVSTNSGPTRHGGRAGLDPARRLGWRFQHRAGLLRSGRRRSRRGHGHPGAGRRRRWLAGYGSVAPPPAASVRLTAPDIAIEGGAGGNSFAEVTAGAGGAIMLGAGNSIGCGTTSPRVRRAGSRR